MAKWAAKPVTLEAIEFDGDEVVAEVKRLQIADMSALVGVRIDIGTAAGQIELCKIASEILPRYLVGIKGLKDEDGNELAMADFLANIGEFYFAPLTAYILVKLIEKSSIKAQEKN